MKDYLSIKEFSKLSGIEQTTLRYWDDIGLFSPARRDPENNYRYYTPEQIIAVNFITVLSDLSIPLKTIGEIEIGRTPEKVVTLVERQERILDMEMRRLRECYSIIHSRLELIYYGKRVVNGFTLVDGVRVENSADRQDGTWVDVNEIAIMQRDKKSYVLGPPNEWEEGEPFFENFIKFCGASDDMRINLSFPIGSSHNDFESFLRDPGQPDHFFSLDPTGNKVRKAGKYLIGFSVGYYGDFGDLAERMTAYIKEKSLKVQGPVFTLYLLDEVCVADPNQYVSQVSVAVT
jgi:DNA-binding transcriptional MerR regulator